MARFAKPKSEAGRSNSTSPGQKPVARRLYTTPKAAQPRKGPGSSNKSGATAERESVEKKLQAAIQGSYEKSLASDEADLSAVSSADKWHPYGMPRVVGGRSTPEMDGCHYGHGRLMMSPKKMRQPKSKPADDAAGLLSVGAWKGRTTPVKGKGLPPPENNETLGPYCVRDISHLRPISQRDPIGVNGYKGLGKDGTLHTQRKKSVDDTPAIETHMLGAVIKPQADADSLSAPRKLRGAGKPPSALAVNTSHRVMGTKEGLTADDINPGLEASHRTAYGALRRPSTAHADFYRGTVGTILKQEDIEPPKAPMSNVMKQLMAPKTPSQQEERIRAGGQAAWSDAHNSAAANRARGSAGSVVFG